MLSFVKLLKVALPVATTTAATIATTFLVSFGKQDPKHIEENIDKGLDDFQKPSENFEDKKMYYSTKGEAEGLTKLNDEQAEEFAKRLKEQSDEAQGIEPKDIPEKVLEGKEHSLTNSSLPNQESDSEQIQELNSSSKDINEPTQDFKDLTQDTLPREEDESVNVAKPEDGALDDKKTEVPDGDNDKGDTNEKGNVQNFGSGENEPQEHSEISDNNGGLDGEKIEEDTNHGKENLESSEQSSLQDPEPFQKELDSEKSTEPQKNESPKESNQKLNDDGGNSDDDRSKEGDRVNNTKADQDQEGSLDSGHGTDKVNSSPHIPSEEELRTLLGLEAELALVKSGLEGMLDN